jgi:16S rRNA (cytidine1402-2'-O)-methyltransferase
LIGTLYLVATPIGNLEDITLRALRVLGEVAVVAAEDTRAAQHLLDRHKVRARELTSCFEGNEAQRSEALIARLRAGDDVALISEAGTPGVSDPGARLVERAVAAGIRVVPIPGPSAAIAALIASGLPTDEFHFVGFPPRERGPRRERFGALRGSAATLILYESPNRTAETLADLADALGGERRACVARELTKIHEELRRATLAELAAHYASEAPRGEVTILVEGGSEAPAIDLEAEVRRRVAAGENAKEIAAALSLATGKPRRQIYQLALSVKKA